MYLSEMISSRLPSRSFRSNRSSLLNVHLVKIIAALAAFQIMPQLYGIHCLKMINVLSLFRYFVRG